MSNQQSSQNNATQAAVVRRAAAGSDPADGQGAEAAQPCGDAHAMAQAARSVMQPERHDLEWRFYHGAVNG
jgi:hypothetical protein